MSVISADRLVICCLASWLMAGCGDGVGVPVGEEMRWGAASDRLFTPSSVGGGAGKALCDKLRSCVGANSSVFSSVCANSSLIDLSVPDSAAFVRCISELSCAQFQSDLAKVPERCLDLDPQRVRCLDPDRLQLCNRSGRCISASCSATCAASGKTSDGCKTARTEPIVSTATCDCRSIESIERR